MQIPGTHVIDEFATRQCPVEPLHLRISVYKDSGKVRDPKYAEEAANRMPRTSLVYFVAVQTLHSTSRAFIPPTVPGSFRIPRNELLSDKL